MATGKSAGNHAIASFIRTQARGCAAAFTFLTRLPLFGAATHSADDLRHAAVWFPVVGLVVGAVGGATYWLASLLWPPVLAVILSVGITVWMTGAFHEDALADALDGFGGGWDKARVLAIMKDSRIGSYALVGVLLVMAAKIAALSAIAQWPAAGTGDPSTRAAGVVQALVLAHVMGRWSSVPLMWRLPYVRADDQSERPSAGRPFGSGVTGVQALAATGLMLVIAAIVASGRAALIVAITAAVTWIAGRYCDRRIGGITGDALGATNQVVELAVYLVLSAGTAAL
jgi:adenosylcobinamide-GDP ribazoletransferase